MGALTAVYKIGGPFHTHHIFNADQQLCPAAGLHRGNDTNIQCCWPLRLCQVCTFLYVADEKTDA